MFLCFLSAASIEAVFFCAASGSIFGRRYYQFIIKIASMQKIILGTLAGLVAGVAVGLLIAPVSGRDARSNITSGTRKQWRKLWGKPDLDEDPWAEYNERKAAVTENATA